VVVIQCACVCVCARARSAGGGRVTCVSCVALVLGVRLDPQSVRFESRVDTLFFCFPFDSSLKRSAAVR